MDLTWCIVIIPGILLIGYIWGRRFGVQEGIKIGRALAPLELRQQSLEKGYCILCKEPSRVGRICPPPLLML